MRTLLRVLAGLGLLGLLAAVWPSGAQAEDARRALVAVRLHAQHGPIGTGVLVAWLWIAAYVVRSERLFVEWHGRAGLSRATCLRLVCRHDAMLRLLPLRAGDATLPWLLQREHGVPLAQGTASLVGWRLQDVLVLSLLGSVLVLPRWSPLAAGVLAASVVLVMACMKPLARALQTRRRGRRAWVDEVLSTAVHAAVSPRTWGLSLLGWALRVVSLGWGLSALAGVPHEVGVVGALGGDLGAAIPFQVFGGFGSVELATWGAVRLGFESVPTLDLISGALALHIVTLSASAVIGALACWVEPSAVARASVSAASRPLGRVA